MWRAAKLANAGVPGRFQTFVEMMVDMVEEQAKSIVPSEVSRRFVSPLALTVFLWIILMNMLALVPVDFLAWVFKMQGLGAAHGDRSEERRVGKGGVSTCRYRWSTDH